MVGDIFTSVCKVLIDLLSYVISAFLCVFIPVCIMCIIFFVVGLIRGKKIPHRTKRTASHYTQPFNPVRLLLWEFPRQLVKDYFSRNPDGFDVYGVHLFCGEQGSGKSIASMHFIKMIKERNPTCRICSNIDINFQDGKINDWTDILNNNNGENGQVIFLDEMQNWFSSNESKNFPPEMLTEITQQRKQRKIVVGTSQVFTRVSKPIREQITLLYKPMTIAGCLTIVRVYRVGLNDDGTVKKMKMVKWYPFVHDEELRNCYDTYEKVERLSIKGFQPRAEQINGAPVPTAPQVVVKK